LAVHAKNLIADTRLKVDNEKVATVYHRTTGRVNEFRFGIIGVLDIANKSLVKKDLLVGYESGDVDVSLKALQPFGKKTENYQNWREWFSSYVLTSVYKRNNKERYGVEVAADPIKDKVTATGLVEYKHTDKNLTRIKFNNHLDLTILLKNTITDKLSFSFGALIPLKREKDAEVKNKYGIQLDFNI